MYFRMQIKLNNLPVISWHVWLYKIPIKSTNQMEARRSYLEEVFQCVSLDGTVFIYRIRATTYIIVCYYTNVVQLLIFPLIKNNVI